MTDTPKITEAEAEAAFSNEWGFRSQTRSLGERDWTRGWFMRGWRAGLDAVKAETEPPAEDVREALAAFIFNEYDMHKNSASALARRITERFSVSPKKGQDK